MVPMRQIADTLVREAVLAVDVPLRRLEGIYEFSSDPECVLRVSRSHSPRSRSFADGTVVNPGDLVMELHWWNERIPRKVAEGANLSSGLYLYRAACHSLQALAHHLDATPGLEGVVALYGQMSILSEASCLQYARMLARVGFELDLLPAAKHPLEKAVRLMKHMHMWGLTRAFNPLNLRGKRLYTATRAEAWISRACLMKRYGSGDMHGARLKPAV